MNTMKLTYSMIPSYYLAKLKNEALARRNVGKEDRDINQSEDEKLGKS